jgi:hypothetical protein
MNSDKLYIQLAANIAIWRSCSQMENTTLAELSKCNINFMLNHNKYKILICRHKKKKKKIENLDDCIEISKKYFIHL